MLDIFSIQGIIDKIQMAEELSACEILNQSEEHECFQKEVEALRLSLQEKVSVMHDLTMKNSNHTPVKNIAPNPPNGSIWGDGFKISVPNRGAQTKRQTHSL